MRFDLYEEADTDGQTPALSWDNGHLSGTDPALADFHDRVATGQPVTLMEPSPPMAPGFDTWQQFLATAYDLPYTWDDVSGDNEALDAVGEYAGEPSPDHEVPDPIVY